MIRQISDTSEPETLRFGYGDTALGTILVAESALGVVALFIGDDRARFRRDLKDAFPEAECVLDQTGLAPTIAKAAAQRSLSPSKNAPMRSRKGTTGGLSSAIRALTASANPVRGGMAMTSRSSRPTAL